MPYDFVLLPGDGIGVEVMGEARKVLNLLQDIFRFEALAFGGK